jgi:hypothetical protein
MLKGHCHEKGVANKRLAECLMPAIMTTNVLKKFSERPINSYNF